MRANNVVLATLCAVSMMVASGTLALGEEENPGKRSPLGADKGPREPSERGGDLQGQRRFGDGAPTNRGPAQMVAMLMRQFDKDNDQKLDSQELTALLTSMRDRQMQMGGQPPMGPLQANRVRAGGMEGRRGGVSEEAGGVTPKRPPVEE